ncbi:MAG: hypothetical protein ACI90V_003509 [Bacillariaceae sp.]|jgi:hypothetical protein
MDNNNNNNNNEQQPDRAQEVGHQQLGSRWEKDTILCLFCFAHPRVGQISNSYQKIICQNM